MNVLVIVAHPDDEVLGAGGTIARHAARGDNVRILIIADGETSRPGAPPAAMAARQKAAADAARVLGAQLLGCLGLPDQRLDTVPLLEIVQKIEALARKDPPSLVYTHHPHDLNSDHRIVANAVMTAFRPVPGSSVRAIFACEIASSTEWAAPDPKTAFLPRRFVDISATLGRKTDALRCYDSEMRAFPHARSYEAVEALARWRGASVGLPAAEAFDILREIDVA
jgi:LmbE family N-acetylglucosaminyl deacetylase